MEMPQVLVVDDDGSFRAAIGEASALRPPPLGAGRRGRHADRTDPVESAAVNPDGRIQVLVNHFVADVTRLAREAAVESLTNATFAATTTPAPASRRGRAAPAATRVGPETGRRTVGVGKGAKRVKSDVEQLGAQFLA